MSWQATAFTITSTVPIPLLIVIVFCQNQVGHPARLPETTKKAMSLKTSAAALRNAPRRTLPDITSLDIKSSVNVGKSSSVDEFDFFRDMEPVIAKTESIQHLPVQEPSSKTLSRFDMDPTVKLEVGNDGEGWGDGTGDWSDIE